MTTPWLEPPFCSNFLFPFHSSSMSSFYILSWPWPWKCVSFKWSICVVGSNLTLKKEQSKQYLEARNIPLASNLGGAIGAFFHDIWMNPCEVVKQRLQMKNSPYFNQSYSRIISQIYRTEGFSAFYLSFPTQLFMNATSGLKICIHSTSGTCPPSVKIVF